MGGSATSPRSTRSGRRCRRSAARPAGSCRPTGRRPRGSRRRCRTRSAWTLPKRGRSRGAGAPGRAGRRRPSAATRSRRCRRARSRAAGRMALPPSSECVSTGSSTPPAGSLADWTRQSSPSQRCQAKIAFPTPSMPARALEATSPMSENQSAVPGQARREVDEACDTVALAVPAGPGERDVTGNVCRDVGLFRGGPEDGQHAARLQRAGGPQRPRVDQRVHRVVAGPDEGGIAVAVDRDVHLAGFLAIVGDCSSRPAPACSRRHRPSPRRGSRRRRSAATRSRPDRPG